MWGKQGRARMLKMVGGQGGERCDMARKLRFEQIGGMRSGIEWRVRRVWERGNGSRGRCSDQVGRGEEVSDDGKVHACSCIHRSRRLS